MADVMIYKPGDLPVCCTETLFQATSNWLYVELAKSITGFCLPRYVLQAYFVYKSFTVVELKLW